MRIFFRQPEVDELAFLLQECRLVIQAKNELLKIAASRISELEDALLTEKRCHMTVAAASSQAIAEGIDLREELDEIAVQLRGDIAQLEEWFVRDSS